MAARLFIKKLKYHLNASNPELDEGELALELEEHQRRIFDPVPALQVDMPKPRIEVVVASV